MKADYPLYKYSFDFVGNEDKTEFSLIVYLQQNSYGTPPIKRLRIPLPQGFLEKLTENGWECDNLDYIEWLAKQKGLL